MVAVNDYQAGIELGRWVVSYTRRYLGGRIVALDVTAPMSNTDARSRGFADGLRELPPSARTVLRVDGGSHGQGRVYVEGRSAGQPGDEAADSPGAGRGPANRLILSGCLKIR